MYRLATTVWLLACFAIAFSQTNTQVSGTVKDDKKQPVVYANIYLKGTLNGTSTDDNGRFALTTQAQDTVTLVVSAVGYESYTITDEVKNMSALNVVLRSQSVNLNEVVIYAGNYQLKSSSTINKTRAVDLLSTAGSSGDLYHAISLLPGTQASDRDGRLLVRGGDSRETQTYIDDMHVLAPYTQSFGGNVGSRGRYSPSLFDGINFSMGGYVPEYSQGLSAVLPLYTRDEAKRTKLGVDVMNVSLGNSATFPWQGGSTSYSLQYIDLSLYNSLFFPSVKPNWKKPYRQVSLQHQLRFNLAKNTSLKTYLGWSKTGFTLLQSKPFDKETRDMRFDEDNIYFNTTFRKKYSNGLTIFSGAAYSLNRQKIDNAQTLHDRYNAQEQELHLKAKAEKRFSNLYKIMAGAEAFARQYTFHYSDAEAIDIRFRPGIAGAFVSNDFNVSQNIFLNLSARLEYSSLSDNWQLLPRAAVGYKWNHLTLSGVIGQYQQTAANEVLLYSPDLLPMKNVQALLGLYYERGSKMLRVEAYRKRYNRLPLKSENSFAYTSDGYGYSNGIDIFYNDTQFLNNWEYTIAYSFNDSKRKYLDFPQQATPSFAMRHNASVTIKYTNMHIRSIVGITNRFASGRTYHNPNQSGFMNSQTPNYNSVDLSWVFLANKRTILYLGLSNILNRTNIYGYAFDSAQNNNARYNSIPLTQDVNRSLYIGCFISLGKNAAYNTSNFF